MKKLILFAWLLIYQLTNAQTNYAVNYDGINDYTSLPASVAVSQLNTFTIEAWVYWTGAGSGCIYSETIVGNNNPMFSIIPRSSDGGGIELTFRDNAAVGLTLQPATATIAINKWVHVAVVRTSATNMKIYIDGILKDDAPITIPAAWTPDNVNIGVRRRVAQTDPFTGKIDEVRIWNTARTAAGIRANMFNKNLANNAAGLVAYYRFNEGSNNNAANSCTNTSSIDGTLTNGPTWVNSPVQFSANALHFDQIDDQVLAPVPTTATSNVTMEGWIYHNGGTGTDHLVMANGLVGSNGYTIYINTAHTLVIRFGGVNIWNTGVAVPVNQWTHLALVISTTGYILYKDGVNVYSNTGTPLTPTTNLMLGFNAGVGQPFDGSIDEVRLWNTARTQSEIQNNMSHEIDPATPGLAAYYTFNQGIANADNTGLVTLIDATGNNNGILSNFALISITSNYVAQFSSLIILPLQWLSFTAKKQNSDVLLQWSTAQEQNTKDFTIQQSIDGSRWTSIATILVTGNSGPQNDYSYLHTAPANGINYYRILQTDADNQFSYSAIRTVAISTGIQPVHVTGNPVINGRLQLKVNTSSSTIITFYSSDCKLLWKKQLANGVYTFDVSGYAKGLYLLKSGDVVEKVVVQ